MDYSTTSQGLTGAQAGGLAAFGGVMWILWLAFIVIYLVAMWKIFVKAGEEGWKCLIPIYNIIILLKIVGRPWWWLLLMFIPFVNFVILDHRLLTTCPSPSATAWASRSGSSS